MSAALPPRAAARPATLNGTMPVYCQEVPSTKFVPLAGLKPPVQAPLACLGCMNPLDGLKVFCQFCARPAKDVWFAVSPSAPANAESAKSAVSYSSCVETGP